MLRRPGGSAEGPPTEPKAGETLPEMGRSTHGEFLRSRGREGAEAELAPDDQRGMSQGAGDVAELLALLSPSVGVNPLPAPAEPSLASPAGAAQVADLVERWVRRVALGGDQRRGVARLDIAEGRYAGAELLVSAEAGHVSVELTLPEAPADAGLCERLRARLEQRGLSADVTVR
jgi:hypothetical protein